jgi:diguanylate cyclase (GGDEF)-like protein
MSPKNNKLHFYHLSYWQNKLQVVNEGHLRVIWSIFIIAFAVVIFILNYNSSRFINVFPLNLAPVLLAVWKLGLAAGVATSIFCCLMGFVTEFFTKPEASLVVIISITLARIIILSFLAYGSWAIQAMLEYLLEVGLKDTLTDMNNRRAFFTQGYAELLRTMRAQNPISVLFLDLDNFKTVNDQNGHAVGDVVLQVVASIIKTRLRQIDIPARLGGDEFAVILPSTDGAGALKLGKELHKSIGESLLAMGVPISISIGIATFYTPPATLDYALQCADSLMYEIKNSTKNAVLQRDF